MSECSVCGKRIILPYKCSYCGLYFCDEHRLPENHHCTGLPKRSWNSISKIEPLIDNVKLHDGETNTLTSIKKTYLRFVSKFRIRISRLRYIDAINIIVNTLFLSIISLPVLDSLLLMWNSPMTFSRTILPKWWNIFPSEYPIPSVNLLYVYAIMLIVFIFVAFKFVSKAYRKYYSIERKIKYYLYVIVVGIVFLYFFSEANFFWAYSLKKLISSFIGGN